LKPKWPYKSNDMRIRFTIIFLLCSVYSFSQTKIQGVVKDSKNSDALPYCNIAIKGTTKGTIANSDGVYQLTVDETKDTVVFSLLGYERLVIPASKLYTSRAIYLTGKEIVLQELIVHANEDYLYNILEDCRKKLRKDNNQSESKMYYGLETQINDQSAELLECYYNAYLNGISIDELRLKNGRVGLAIVGSRIFNNWETSIAISKLDLLNKNYYYPSVPLQYTKKEMKNIFDLSMAGSDSSMYHIRFSPLKDSSEHFAGEVWIDKQTLLLLKINLKIKNASVHPFVSWIEDSISNVSLEITQSFSIESNVAFPEHTLFNYSMRYVTGTNHARITDVVLPDMARVINTSCMLYYYDYGKPFYLPYFEYDSETGDYVKISMIPYNDAFWDNNKALLLTEKQKEKLGFFAKEGYLINFKEGNYGQDFCDILNNDRQHYHTNYTFWSANKRIFFARGLPQTEIYPPEKINQNIQSDLYHLKVQLLLDINPVGDSLDCRSYTVFDEVQTSFHLPRESYTIVFLNIYFDICEIERRKMEKTFHQKRWTLAEVDSIYKESVKAMDQITLKYLNEVEVGKNEKTLQSWNKYVIDNLNIDNLKLFEEKK
jgi:hypothetical protein